MKEMALEYLPLQPENQVMHDKVMTASRWLHPSMSHVNLQRAFACSAGKHAAFSDVSQCTVCNKSHGAVHLLMLDTRVTQKTLQEAAVHEEAGGGRVGQGEHASPVYDAGAGGEGGGGGGGGRRRKPYAVRQCVRHVRVCMHK